MTARPPLDGVRVLDLTTFLSGPFCTQALADLGAEVTKVEGLDGDSSRAIPPYFVGDDSAYFLSVNRTKRSIAVDLKTDEGSRLVRQLVGAADVVVENFRPGVAARLGLDAAELCEEHPSLIWASITGFGKDGPWRDRPAYDLIVQALSGVMSLTGEPGRPSVRLGIPAGDLVAGMYAAMGVLAALVERARTGEGHQVDVSMLDGQLAMLSYQASYALIGGATPGPQGSRHDSIPTYRTFVASDGREVAVTANTQRMWIELCGVLGRPDLPEDPRFAEAGDRLVHREQLWDLLEPAFLADDANAWVRRLNAVGVPAAPIRSVPEALRDSEDRGDGLVMDLSSSDGHHIRAVGNPIRLEPPAEVAHRYPPRLGEHTTEVLRDDLGLTAEAIEELRRKRVVA